MTMPAYRCRIERRGMGTWETIEGTRFVHPGPLSDFAAAAITAVAQAAFGPDVRIAWEVVESGVYLPPTTAVLLNPADRRALAIELMRLHKVAAEHYQRLNTWRMKHRRWSEAGATVMALDECRTHFKAAASDLERLERLLAETERLLGESTDD